VDLRSLPAHRAAHKEPDIANSKLDNVRAALPEGSVAVAVGVFVAGVAAFGFLSVSARALEPSQYSDLAALWILGFIAGPGVFMPLEQEVARAIAARRARGLGARPVVQRAIILGGAMLAILALASVAVAGPVTSHLFDHKTVLFIGFLICLASLYVGYLGRGYLSGNGKFTAYSWLVALEGVSRLLPVVVFAGVGWKTVGPYGLAFGAAPLFAYPLVLSRQRRLTSPGPEARWGELTTALGYLVLAALLTQLLLNLAPVTVKLLAGTSQKALAGQFLAGLVIARVPVVLFQAVLAALLPKLAHLAASNKFKEFEATVLRLLAAIGGLGVLAIIGATVAGNIALHVMNGPKYSLARSDFAFLSAASIVFILALTMAQALIALRSYAYLSIGWIAGAAGFAASVAIVHPLLLRVEVGFLVGSATSLVVLGLLLLQRLPRTPEAQRRLQEQLREAHPVDELPTVEASPTASP
jgi:O-antigen/teichoic acid export membrane protein